ncbi:unnamed protein product [Eruca vesicaria subsp. sativa]|uniref:Protein kinase domain-containing protein n=1 Tax=Eruca vesicaria subsp. sativa TaxID=29727 RepID=A0ABC8IMJ9_ERUVS|nr:unnamed protein product [Eruca vesicaria subsp. sativa]
MESHQGYLWALIFNIFALLHLVRAQSTEGFISLDCGLPAKESPYTDQKTGLVFSSDAEFISSGQSGKVRKNYTGDYKPHNVLRYFPDGVRNCYDIRVKQGTNYLIRAEFVYGNYDGLNVMPRFYLYIGPNIFAVVGEYDRYPGEELIHMTKSNSLQICLVKNGATIPFISSLELRPLASDSYSTQSDSLKLISRGSMVDEGHTIRYPDDVYDRKWSYTDPDTRVQKLETTLTVNSSNPYKIPQPVIKLGFTFINESEPVRLLHFNEDFGDNYYFYLHFAEIKTLEASDTREFTIIWNANTPNPVYSPKMFHLETILINASTKQCYQGECELQLVRTPESTLPPLINAYEAFRAVVVAIKSIQTAYQLKVISWQGDPCVPQEFKWDYVDCSYTDKSTPPRIISLDLSKRGLKGSIAPALQNLTQLQKLDLSSNSLSGEVPEFLANMKSLSTINLSGNNLKGLIPQALLDKEKNGLTLNVQGNRKLCFTDKCKNKTTVIVIVSIAAGILVVAMILLYFAIKRKRMSKAINKSAILPKQRRFTHSEVEVMTYKFRKNIGEGGFGTVYHGFLTDMEQVAVKVLSQSSIQGYKQFKAEVELLLRVHHTNLISLVGYCDEDDHLALIYEYAANGDLKQYLSGESTSGSLNWASRLKIMTETAQGLEYLHIGSEPRMIHRDVKTTNILLDENFQAKLADFGLSRSFPNGVETHVSTNVAGTPGYLDPEYYRTNWLTEKSDVYSLGIVLLEIITNCPVIQQTREKPHIAEWVGLMLTKGDIASIMDPNLKGDYDSRSVWRAVELAMSCVNPSSAARPNMSQVISALKECIMYENSNKGGRSDLDSNSSPELSFTCAPEVTPDAR